MQVGVAGMVIDLDLPDLFLGENMAKFRLDSGQAADVAVRFASGPFPAPESGAAAAHTVRALRGGEYCYFFTANDMVTHFCFNESYSEFILHRNPGAQIGDPCAQAALTEAVHAALRRVFIMIIASQGGVCLHASTVEWGGEAVCFSARSGGGKTTHTDLWRAAFSPVTVLNGDNGYVFSQNGSAVFHGAPWCGTSGECVNANRPVRAVVFLEQARCNTMRKLGAAEAFMRFYARCFLPHWEKKLSLKTVETAERITGAADCFVLQCLPNQDAASVCFHGIYQP